MNNVWQFIIPLGFLAIWALTSLFNREEQPLPPRAGRPQGGDGPRPLPNPAGRPLERRPDPIAAREPPMRWAPQGGTATARPAPVRLDDDIVILDSEARRPPAASRPARPVTQKRDGRQRGSSSQPAKKAEPTPPRLLAAPLSTSMAPLQSRPFEMAPLELPKESLWTADSMKKATAPVSPTKGEATGSKTIDELLATVKSPEKMRQSLILAELLQPPLALRGRRR